MAEAMSLKDTDESTAAAAVECSQEYTGSEQQSCSSGDRSDADTLKQPCAFFMRTGTCAYGNRCKFSHPEDRPQVFMNNRGLPLRPEEPDCAFYVRNGWCAFSDTCKFHHPDLPPGQPQNGNGSSSGAQQQQQHAGGGGGDQQRAYGRQPHAGKGSSGSSGRRDPYTSNNVRGGPGSGMHGPHGGHMGGPGPHHMGYSMPVSAVTHQMQGMGLSGSSSRGSRARPGGSNRPSSKAGNNEGSSGGRAAAAAESPAAAAAAESPAAAAAAESPAAAAAADKPAAAAAAESPAGEACELLDQREAAAK
ncbi:hypothetical protein OEZ85_012227 [Tetradesmus obliquus]|uniref:C3H1-type domain-containing protein n=1 Tax=Tetradesmus obliquus TaxID=3088 RepID=A0ABY8TT35_TETOB|nr:hypothetical protein OEZ85_012227 [Tetradesmus obliquus]